MEGPSEVRRSFSKLGFSRKGRNCSKMTHLEQKEEKTEKSFQPKIKISNTRHLAMVTMGKYETSATIRSSEQKARWKEDNMFWVLSLYFSFFRLFYD